MKIRLLLFLLHGWLSTMGQVSTKATLFTEITSQQSDIGFINRIHETQTPNVIEFVNLYNGGGVAAGDINNDGLPDLFFVSNKGESKLYLNLGHLRFKDITKASGIAENGPWKTGVTLVDINGDGYLDVYCCHGGYVSKEKRKNKLYINQKNGTFKEGAEKYGLAETGYSVQASFFDFDRDGDLDVYIVNTDFKSLYLNEKLSDTVDENVGDKLFRNDNGTFHDITKTAGISQRSESPGHAVVVGDINNDQWPDLYVTNDFYEHDYLYVNNHNGTFSEQSSQTLAHMSESSMGCEIVDVNNDGLLDIITLDMLPEDNRRQKLFLTLDNYEDFEQRQRNGYQNQFMHNTLQLNNGDGTFSETACLAGIASTDWSWAPLVTDFDNDGYKDLYVSNGYLRDMIDRDFLKFFGDQFYTKKITPNQAAHIVQSISSTPLVSYIFKNKGDGTFEQKKDWGIYKKYFSNGAVYADLDGDGDEEIIVNNINAPASIYKNNSVEQSQNHWLNIVLKGQGQNSNALGAKIFLYTKEGIQFIEHTFSRGYLSAMADAIHFGLGRTSLVDSIRILWPDGNQTLATNITVDQKIVFTMDHTLPMKQKSVGTPIFKPYASQIHYKQPRSGVNDFKRQPLLLHMYSNQGPKILQDDFNGDGLQDLFVYGGSDILGILYLRKASGYDITFLKTKSTTSSQVSGACLVDIDKDGDQDLYLTMGGYNDYTPYDSRLQDRLFINDGNGSFQEDTAALPIIRGSKSCVRSLDFNKDGYPDLFIAGRVVPGAYPKAAPSYLLQNDQKGHFVDVTKKLAAALSDAGMIIDVLCLDINHDGTTDILTVGEWMGVDVWEISEHGFEKTTNRYFDHSYSGLWNTLVAEDIDGDGDLDLLVGNMGLNTHLKANDTEPLEMIYADFDQNGSIDPFLCCFVQGASYPYSTRDELADQIFTKRSKFPTHKSYANATIKDLFTPAELKESKTLRVNELETCLFINEGGKFNKMALPIQAQYAPVYKILVMDVDNDQKKDIILLGNQSDFKIRLGKCDANYGIVLKNEGNNRFSYLPQLQTGLSIKGDVKDACYDPVQKLLYITRNQDEIITYSLQTIQ